MPDIVVMFFLLGLLAGVVKSDLNIPKAAYDTLSLLLMLTIGLKGGMALYGNLRWSLIPELAAVAALGALIPLALMPILRRLTRLSPPTARVSRPTTARSAPVPSPWRWRSQRAAPCRSAPR